MAVCRSDNVVNFISEYGGLIQTACPWKGTDTSYLDFIVATRRGRGTGPAKYGVKVH